jgi:hypothetical protein
MASSAFKDLYALRKNLPPNDSAPVLPSDRAGHTLKKVGAYVSGGIPIALFCDLEVAGRHAHSVFMCILRRSRMKQMTIIPFAAADVPVPLDERARRRAIRNLTAAGFVRVEQREGRPPLVDVGPALERYPILQKSTRSGIRTCGTARL